MGIVGTGHLSPLVPPLDTNSAAFSQGIQPEKDVCQKPPTIEPCFRWQLTRRRGQGFWLRREISGETFRLFCNTPRPVVPSRALVQRPIRERTHPSNRTIGLDPGSRAGAAPKAQRNYPSLPVFVYKI